MRVLGDVSPAVRALGYASPRAAARKRKFCMCDGPDGNCGLHVVVCTSRDATPGGDYSCAQMFKRSSMRGIMRCVGLPQHAVDAPHTSHGVAQQMTDFISGLPSGPLPQQTVAAPAGLRRESLRIHGKEFLRRVRRPRADWLMPHCARLALHCVSFPYALDSNGWSWFIANSTVCNIELFSLLAFPSRPPLSRLALSSPALHAPANPRNTTLRDSALA